MKGGTMVNNVAMMTKNNSNNPEKVI